MKKVIFSNKETKEAISCMAGNLGEHVYKATKSTQETNNAIRWCNRNGVGEELETEKYKIVIISM